MADVRPTADLATSPVRFFIPHAKPSEYEAQYASMIAAVKDQMRWVIGERRIFRIEYTHDKKRHSLQVGEVEAMGRDYEVCAILESNSYIAITKDLQGKLGVTIMVDKDEVTASEDFQAVKVAS